MKADDRILSAARKAKGCPFQGFSRVRQPWQDLKASRAPLRRALFGDRRFESFFLQRGVGCELDFLNHGRRRPFVCNDMAFGIWVGLSPKETRSCGWD